MLLFPPFYNILGGPAHNKGWTSQIMATTYLEFDKTISQLVELKKGCYHFSFDYALNNHTYDASRKPLSYFHIVFNNKIVHKATVTNLNIKRFGTTLHAVDGWNNFTIIGRNTVVDKATGKDVRTYRATGLDNFKL